MFDFEGSRGEFLKLLAEMGENPAFIQRARAQENALNALLERCTASRAQLLEWPRRHYTILRKRIGDDWDRVSSITSHANAGPILAALSTALPVIDHARPSILSTDRSLLRNFLDSAQRFNRAWNHFLDHAGLDEINRLRDDYNRFYPMEKSCAFGTESVNAKFEPLPPLSRSYLETRFPLLNIPASSQF